jgi:hypothetical protein
VSITNLNRGWKERQTMNRDTTRVEKGFGRGEVVIVRIERKAFQEHDLLDARVFVEDEKDAWYPNKQGGVSLSPETARRVAETILSLLPSPLSEAPVRG